MAEILAQCTFKDVILYGRDDFEEQPQRKFPEVQGQRPLVFLYS